MFKRSLIAASLSVAALVSAQAMAVTGGGASLPAELYKAPPTASCRPTSAMP